MNHSIADILKQLRGILQTMSAGKLLVLFLVVAGGIAGVTVLVSWSGSADLAPLYTHMSPEDAGEVVALLKEKKIGYRLSHDGGTLQIPRDQVYDMRFELASKGLPRNGTGFEIFDNVKLGMTEFVQNINYQRALQGELSRTINGLSEVESSRIHIVMPERSLFIGDEEPASASVILKMRAGRWLSEDQIQGIVHLVSSSVPRLPPKNVTVVDQNGKMLAGLNDSPSMTKLSADHLEFQQKKERMLEKRILSMLEKVLGREKAIVRVACDLDFVQQEKTEEMFWPENQVVRSENLLSESSTEPARTPGGIPGLASNIVPSEGTGDLTGSARGFQKEDKTRNYEIGKTTSRKIMPVGNLQRLSVSVIVDGTYKTDIPGSAGNSQNYKYVARSAEEMLALENIVKSAVNFDPERGDIVHVANIAFNSDETMKETWPETGSVTDAFQGLSYYIKYLIVAVFLMFTFIFVIRPLIRWLTETPWEDVELLENLPRTLSELENRYAGQVASENYVRQAAKLIETKKEDSRRLMQSWLKES
jgi:flagellar M-ring protein FliF